MAHIAAELSAFRALTFRISSTPTSQLPQHVPAIAASLTNCRTLLSSTQTSGSKSSSEASVAVHKYRALLSTLLQDRSIHGRWAAIVLIKATIEVGGWETLQKSLPWVRGLLGILTKPDPPSSKKLSIITLVRIFVLTREYPTLVREMTTPCLPTFIQSCIQLILSKPEACLLQTILESFNQLLPRHPTIFRTFLKQLQPILGQILAPTPSNKLGREQTQKPQFQVTSETAAAARSLHVQVPCCAPKGASNEEWEISLRSTVVNTHRVADKVFRAVVEDWQSSVLDRPTMNGHTMNDEVQDLEADSLALPPWSGIYAGGERLVGLLRLVRAYLESGTASVVNFNLSLIADLLTRMLYLTVPSSTGTKGFQNTVKFNNQVSKEERENLWLVLPSIHIAAIETLLALVQRCDANTSLDTLILDQLVWVFGSEKETTQVRTACYVVVATLLKRSGTTLPKSSVDALNIMIRTCCDDLIPSEQSTSNAKPGALQGKINDTTRQQASTNADALLSSSTTRQDPLNNFDGLKQAAYDLLPIMMADIRAQFVSDSLRARMDRTAVLIQHKDAMVASVLNPPPSKRFGKAAASILPLLAQSFPSDKDVEGLLRPRMPVIRVGSQGGEGVVEVEVDMEEGAVEGSEEQGEDDDHFVGEELDTLLETATQTDTLTGDAAMTDVSLSAVTPQVELSAGATSTSGFEERIDHIAAETLPSKNVGKRSQNEDIPGSPTKRVKTVDETISTPDTTSIPTTITAAPSNPAESSSIIAPASITAPFSATTQHTPLTTVGINDTEQADSDDEDIVPLVFGQDTDEDSDS